MKGLMWRFTLAFSFLCVLVQPGVSVASPEREPLGPASRRTGLVISEIYYVWPCCYRSEDDDCWDAFEFLEIYNSNPFFEDLSGMRLAGNISYQFPEGTTIGGGAFLVLRHWDYSGSVNGCEGVRLLAKNGAVLAEVSYTRGPPWPLANHTGHSIVLKRPSLGQNNPQAWGLSDQPGGSPGMAEPSVTRPNDGLRINELSMTRELTNRFFVEIYNHSNEEIDLSGYIINSPHSYHTVFPQGTLIAARGFAVIQAGPHQGAIYLRTSDHIIDSVWYEAPASGFFGRYPDGTGQFTGLSCASWGGSNCGPQRSQVVINEIMYAPITGDVHDEYLELYNRTSASVDVSEWRIDAGIQFVIPAETIVAPSNYLVVAKDPGRMLSHYPHLSAANVVGGFEGELDDDGERILLANAEREVLDEVTYAGGGQWGNWSRGGGSSLELKDAHSDGRFAHNWADSDESGKGVWSTIEGIASIGEFIGSPVNDQLHIFLLGAGECLVDDVEVRANYGNGPNLLTTNPGFEMGMTGWTAQGSHDHSVISTRSFSGSQSLHLRAATVGDNGPNRVRSSLSPPIAPTDKVLLRTRVKWIRGWPEIALRVRGGGFDVSGRMEILPNGTPGMRNSRAVDNAGPAIAEVSHEPVLPAANEPVRISAMVSDRDGPVLLTLKFRPEPSVTYLTLPMLDNGAGGDDVASDGIYTATVPGQPEGTRMGFYLEAVDALGAVNTFPQDVFPTAPHDRVFPTDAHNRECIVRWGETVLPGAFGTYRLWLNATNTARWTQRRPVMNDTPLDATFVYNDSRVIYNARPAYHSSVWHRGQRTTGPDGTQRIDYSVQFPVDDPFLGVTEALWIHPGNISGNTSSDLSAQAEAAANLIFGALGLQNNYQRYVHVFVNGNRRSMAGTQPFIMQDAQRPNADTLRQWAPEERNSELIWLEDWFEYADNGDDFGQNNDADLQRRETTLYTESGLASGSAFHMGAYRFMFRPTDLRPGGSANDYSTLFALLNRVSPMANAMGAIRLEPIESVIDYEQWMRVIAVQHALGNWDTYAYDRGRNAYLYRGSNQRVQLWPWKNNFTLGIGGHSATMTLFGTTDPRITEMWREPTILRGYWRGFYDIINGPMQNSYLDPILDAKAAALLDNGVNLSAGYLASIKNFIRDRRTYLASWFRGATNPAISVAAINTNGNVITLRGTAPFQVHQILINGRPYPTTWNFVSNVMMLPPTNWTATVALQPGTNHIIITGTDSEGNHVVPPITFSTEYTGPVADAKDNVLISEIMYRPLHPNTEYVEVHNRAANFGFDLSDWRLAGVDFQFPPGTILGPRQFLLLATDPFAFALGFPGEGVPRAYSSALNPLPDALWLLAADGQTLIDRVRYESGPPWPVGASGGGSALQVIDVEEDNSRVSNWTDGLGWRYVTFTGTIFGSTGTLRGTNFSLHLDGPGAVYVDDVVLVRGTMSEVGENVLLNGGFETPLEGTWAALGNHSGSFRSEEVRHSGAASLKVIATGRGYLNHLVRQIIPANTSNGIFTVSFWFLPSTNGSLLVVRTSPGSAFVSETAIAPEGATPGRGNSFPKDLPPYDPIWLNELYFGVEPAVEVYNAGADPVNLEGYHLTQNYLNPALAAAGFPPGSAIGPGEFKVFFGNISPSATALALTRDIGSSTQIVDYFNYADLLYGALPDGQPFARGPLRYPTLRQSNLSPRIASIVHVGNNIYLHFLVIPGYRYNLEYKDRLSEPAWQILYANLVADETDWTYADDPPGNQRFYRLTLIP
jgi:lamin tail-like protein/CotH protein